ncbi:hypothetical protein ABPG72_018448 [Tetrahymena utriculariae]
MGETNSKPQPNVDFLRVFQREYKEIGEEIDTRLGNVKVYQGPQSNLVAVKNSFLMSKELMEEFVDHNLPKALNTQNRYLMKVLSYKTHSEDSMCGSVNGITTYHEYYQNTVQDELVRRQQVSLYYIEQELWAILYSIVSAAYYLQKNNLTALTDIRPSTVYFTLKGEVKLMPFGIYPEDISGYAKCFSQSEQSYLSPEQLEEMRKRKQVPDINQVKSDIYSIGMTMLACATLQTSPSWYNYDECQINYNYVNYLLDFSKNQYSDFFCKVVKIMLSENSEDRPTPSIIYKILQPYEKDILALKPFNPEKEIIKKSLEQESSQLKASEQQGEKLFADDNVLQNGQQSSGQQSNSPIFVKVPYLGEDGKIYYQQAPQQQFEYLIQQSDGQPIPQLENQFFYHDQFNNQPNSAYVVNESTNQSGVYVSYAQPPAQQVEYVQPNTAVSGIQYIQSSAQPQVILNGARQHYSQVFTQPAYQQVSYENPAATIPTAQQIILNPVPQSGIQYEKTSSSPYHPGKSQIISQYSYNIQEKPFTSLPLQQTSTTYPQTGAEITNSHIQINPQSQYTPINNLNVNTTQQQQPNEEGVKRTIRQTQSDQQMVNQDIYTNQIQYNNPPTYSNTFGIHEPESPIGMVSANQYSADINNTAAFQIGTNSAYGGARTDAVQSSNSNYLPSTVVNQQYTSSTMANNEMMNVINRRINQVLQSSQNVISNSQVGKYE